MSSLNETDNKPFEVDHLLYLGWPNFDVPTDSSGFLTFLKRVKQLHDKRCQQQSSLTSVDLSDTTVQQQSSPKPPLLVHCSAGIGRTGRFPLPLRLLTPVEKNVYAF